MNLLPILPEIVLFCGALLILMMDVFFAKKNPQIFFLSHFLALIFTVICCGIVAKNFVLDALLFNNMYASTPFTSFAKLVALLLLSLIIVLSLDFVSATRKVSGEFLALLMIATTGGMILISAHDFLVFYLGLELQALSLYVLAAFNRNSAQSSEAGMKYFILGSLASGILLFGIAMIYGYSGTVNFEALEQLYHGEASDAAFYAKIPVGVMFGLILVLVAMFFKIAAAPFHMWSPDVYQGAPTTIVNFFASVAKFTTLVALIGLYAKVVVGWPGIVKVFLLSSILSLAVGSFGAIFQKNIKRLIAYSGIAHVGFVLLGLVGFSQTAIAVSVFYAVIYALISIGSFAFIGLIKSPQVSDEAIESDEEAAKIFSISSLAGLAKTNPVMSLCFAILMFSSAGIPPLAGFFSKFYVIYSAIGYGFLGFAVIAVIFSVISAFYYLRVVKVMYFDESKNVIELKNSFGAKFVVVLSAALNLAMVLFADPLFNLIKEISIFWI
jgi:NADH-quinone oxidoreductase subunit N